MQNLYLNLFTKTVIKKFSVKLLVTSSVFLETLAYLEELKLQI